MKTKHRCLFKMKADECLSEIMAEEGVEEDRERLDYKGKMILAPMVKVGPKIKAHFLMTKILEGILTSETLTSLRSLMDPVLTLEANLKDTAKQSQCI